VPSPLSLTNILAPALEQRQVSTAPGQNWQLVARCRVVAVAVAEIPVIVFANFTSSPHKIGALVVFTDHKVMIPSRFVGRFPSDQIFMTIRTRRFIHHWWFPPSCFGSKKLRREIGMSTNGKLEGQEGVRGISEILDTSRGLLLGICRNRTCPAAAIDVLTRTPTGTPFVVRYLTTSVKENSSRNRYPFTLRYRRVNG
jgi:hypothetical protein